jgi:hypothetical protein
MVTDNTPRSSNGYFFLYRVVYIQTLASRSLGVATKIPKAETDTVVAQRGLLASLRKGYNHNKPSKTVRA